MTFENLCKITGLRPEIMEFAMQMEKRLKDNEYKDGWSDCKFDFLLANLDVKASKIKRGVLITGSDTEIARNCADLANYAMMISDNVGELNKHH